MNLEIIDFVRLIGIWIRDLEFLEILTSELIIRALVPTEWDRAWRKPQTDAF
jgi:hypothetical protein